MERHTGGAHGDKQGLVTASSAEQAGVEQAALAMTPGSENFKEGRRGERALP